MTSDTALSVFAAGSLDPAFRELLRAFTRRYRIEVKPQFGASGLLRARIEEGEPCDLFASANMRHPEALAKRELSGPVAPFAHNTLVAMVHVRLKAATTSLLDLMLDPEVTVGTSTPRDDPSGDYAWILFKRAEILRKDSFETLSTKARQLAGGPDAPEVPKGQNFYRWVIESGNADIYLTYATNAYPVAASSEKIEVITLPEVLKVDADYGLTVTNVERPEAWQLALFALGVDGRRILERHGFPPPLFTPDPKR